jgi:hypothetical protein
LKDVSCKEVFFRFSKLDFGFIVLFNNLCDNIEKKKSLRVHSKERLSKKTILKELEIILSQKRYYLGKKEFLDLFRKKLHFSRPLKTISLEKLKNIFFELSLNANFNNCTSLEKLNFSKSTISNLNLDNTPNLKEVIGGWMDRDLVLDEKGKEQYMLHAEPFGKDFVIGEVVDDDSDCESDDMEDSDQEEIEYNSRTLTRAEYDKLSEQIAKKEVDINKYRKKIKTKLVKPERDYDAEP